MKKYDALLFLLFAACLGAVVVFAIPGLIPFADETVGNLVRDTVPRLAAACFLILLMVRCGGGEVFRPRWRAADFVWAIPCLLVALGNFPYSTLITGKASVLRAELLPLFLLKCIAVALFEELFFRGILLPVLLEKLKRWRLVLAVLLSSALFALLHLVNLFFGADVGATMLQVGYTFLIGCMLAVTMLRTNNLWLCVLIHAIFDFGGLLISDLGTGRVHDLAFWILTAIIGVLCAVHIVLTGLKLLKKERENPPAAK